MWGMYRGIQGCGDVAPRLENCMENNMKTKWTLGVYLGVIGRDDCQHYGYRFPKS